MACEYCNGIKEHKNQYISVMPDVVIKDVITCTDETVSFLSIEHSEESDNTQVFLEANININFCPMCGRDLKGDE